MDIKTREKSTDYAKIAKAIGAITSRGIKVSLADINYSDYGYKPDVVNNQILYGLKAINGIGGDVVSAIIQNRPYLGINDFIQRCPLSKTAMVNLIKSGAFDKLDKEVFNGNRIKIMIYYILQTCERKKRITLQNFNGLIENNLIPKELEFQLRIFHFNKHLKKYRKINDYYIFDDRCLNFYNRFLLEYADFMEYTNDGFGISIAQWEKLYKKNMEDAKNWIQQNQEKILEEYNHLLFMEQWKKYANGSISKWEMDSVCFYHSPHELINLNNNKYGIINFNSLNPKSEIDYYYKRGKVEIPIFKLSRIAGVVLAKNDIRHTVALLTTTGVVSVKFTREYYSNFKKQISQIQADGSKKVMEKGWFGRGNLLIVTGYRRDDQFVGKTYKNTSGHQLYKIEKVKKDGTIEITSQRWSADNIVYEEED